LGNINLNDTLNSNGDDEHLVVGQVHEGGVEDDDFRGGGECCYSRAS